MEEPVFHGPVFPCEKCEIKDNEIKMRSKEMEFMRKTNSDRLGEIDSLRAELAELKRRVRDELGDECDCGIQRNEHDACGSCQLYRDCAEKEEAK